MPSNPYDEQKRAAIQIRKVLLQLGKDQPASKAMIMVEALAGFEVSERFVEKFIAQCVEADMVREEETAGRKILYGTR